MALPIDDGFLMRLLLFGFLLSCCSVLNGQISVGDIPTLLGEGDDIGFLVIDFNNGMEPDSFVWGYRFDEPSFSGADLLLAVAALDPTLSIGYGGNGSDGFFLTSVRFEYAGRVYEQEGVYPTASWGYYLAGGNAGGTAVTAAGGADFPASWEASTVGASDTAFGTPGRILTDGAWDYWSVGPYDTTTFSHLGTPAGTPVPAPIPEPTYLTFFLVIGSWCLWGSLRGIKQLHG